MMVILSIRMTLMESSPHLIWGNTQRSRVSSRSTTIFLKSTRIVTLGIFTIGGIFPRKWKASTGTRREKSLIQHGKSLMKKILARSHNTTKISVLLQISFIDRNKNPFSTEFNILACSKDGVMICLDFKRFRKRIYLLLKIII